VTLCVLCHTAGAEDDSGTGVSIDFKVMIHKIHAGEHLPSVLGVTTNPDGSRNYAAGAAPYLVSGHDFSHVPFPAWPQGLVPLPRDQGYSALSSDDKAKEDEIRKGPSNCAVCHGDPDGDDGPLTAPAQGDLARTQPTRQACGSCHDDVIWGQSYTANGQTMGAQANNANCKLCHADQGSPLAVFDAHLHPLHDPTFDTGTNLDVSDLSEAGTNDGDETLDPGEKISIHLRHRRRRGRAHRAGVGLESVGGDLRTDEQLQPAPEHVDPDRRAHGSPAVHGERAHAGAARAPGRSRPTRSSPSPATSRPTGT
jgi:OmcA/MtrC family decaheme c-type cytochrome